MPYKRTLRDNNTFLVLYQEYNEYFFCQEFTGIKKAVEGYRKLRILHGDNCRLVKVVADYGEEI